MTGCTNGCRRIKGRVYREMGKGTQGTLPRFYCYTDGSKFLLKPYAVGVLDASALAVEVGREAHRILGCTQLAYATGDVAVAVGSIAVNKLLNRIACARSTNVVWQARRAGQGYTQCCLAGAVRHHHCYTARDEQQSTHDQ